MVRCDWVVLPDGLLLLLCKIWRGSDWSLNLTSVKYLGRQDFCLFRTSRLFELETMMMGCCAWRSWLIKFYYSSICIFFLPSSKTYITWTVLIESWCHQIFEIIWTSQRQSVFILQSRCSSHLIDWVEMSYHTSCIHTATLQLYLQQP
jgi:hypothetical protein